MPLAQGLYKSQDQQEQDLTDGPGWTIDDQKPSSFGGALSAVPRGIGQGVSEGISMLTHGINAEAIPAMIKANPFASMLGDSGESFVKGLPGAQTAEASRDALDAMSERTREFSKSLVGDPRTTGAAANVIQGFSKAATEFTLGSLAGGPEVGAAFLGATDGYAHYNDLLDLGVDEQTAQKSGMTTAMMSGGAAFLPMAMPAKWLAGLATPAALGVQAATGAAVNTGFGVANRYGEAKILRDAGYDTMADQQEPWDKANLLTDAISGAFFGVHSGWHGIKELDGKRIDPSVLDAAKVVQDRQAVIDAAPGIPVDAKSAAVHRQALETSVGDLLTGKPVDLSEIDTAGAAFARGDVDQSAATKIIRDAFVKSGVLDDEAFAGDLDWLRGEKEEPASQPAVEKPESVKPEPAEEAGGYDVGESEEMSDELARKFEGLRSKLPADQAARTAGEGEPEEPVSGRQAGGEGEPLTVHRGAPRPLSPEDFSDAALGHQTGRPSSGLGPFFTNDKAEAAGYGEVSSHHLAMVNPLEMKAEDVPGFDSIKQAIKWREKQRAKGYDGLVIDASHMGGQTWYVPFEHSQVKAPVKSRTAPDFHNWFSGSKIADATGAPLTMYHGTKADFEDFSAVKPKYGAQDFGEAYFFSDRGDKTPSMLASSEGGRILPSHLSIKNPMEINGGEWGDPRAEAKLIERAKQEGHDGLVGTTSGGEKFAVAFSKDQIRSAIANNAQLADRPDLEIADENGAPTSAADALANATAEEEQANKEADPMHEAAVKCEMRHA